MEFGVIYSGGNGEDHRMISYEEHGRRFDIETLLVRSFYFVALDKSAIRRRKKGPIFFEDRIYTFDDRNYFYYYACKTRDGRDFADVKGKHK